LKCAAILRNEESATDEKDSSCSGMQKLKKIATKSRASIGNKMLNVHFLKMLHFESVNLANYRNFHPLKHGEVGYDFYPLKTKKPV